MQQYFRKSIVTVVMPLLAVFSLSSQAAGLPQAGNYQIDSSHTSVLFKVTHVGMSHLLGTFNKVSGKITLQADGTGTLSASIPTKGINTNHAARDKHLRSPDFFNANQFPMITFKADQVKIPADGSAFKITGELSMHGKSQNVTLDVNPVGFGKDPWGGYRIGYQAKTSLKRSDFGMNYMQGGLGNNIEIEINIEAKKM